MRWLTFTTILLAAGCTLAAAWTGPRSAKAESTKLKTMLDSNDEAALRQVFSTWAADHGRRFAARSVEDSRFEQFKRGLRRIVDINADPSRKWWAAPNQYTDLTFEEFQQQYTGAVKPPEVTEAPARSGSSGGSGGGARRLLQDVPTVVDWVAKKKVTPVKSQGACGACWAFAALSALESKYLITKHKRLDLSEQHMIDCVNSAAGYVSKGCAGGWPSDVLSYAYKYNVTQEAKYQYEGKTNTCNSEVLATSVTNEVLRVGKSMGYRQVPSKSASDLMKAVAKAPVVGAFNVEESFQFYAGGVYQASSCRDTTVNHAMSLVGYNAAAGVGSPDSYWLIKNSWGVGWGEQGYARVQMLDDGPGACAMYYYNYEPLGVKAGVKPIKVAVLPSPSPSPPA